MTANTDTINERRQRLTYVLTDFVMLNLGWFLFTVVRYMALPYAFAEFYPFSRHITSLPVMGGQILFPLMMVGFYWLSGYYNLPYFKSRLDELVNTATVSAVGSLVIFFAVLYNDGIPERLHNIEMMGLLWLFFFVPTYIGRAIITRRATQRIHNREIGFNTLVVGTGRSAIELAERLMHATRGNGFAIVGFVETNPGRIVEADTGDMPVYNLDDIQDVISRYSVKRLIVVPHHSGMRHTAELINNLIPTGCNIFVPPDLYNLIVSRPRIGDIGGEPLMDITSGHTPQMTVNLKRVADVTISSIALIILSPVYLGLAIAVKLDSPGPVIYRQERIGYRKRPFDILKFRSMRVDAEAGGPALTSLDDPRVTRLGAVMRKYRLDELPQFFNVLRGDMSLVGPRPEREYYIRQIVARAPYYNLMHRVRPGITSWGMVKFGYATTVDQMIERLRYDMIYLENVSLPVDVKILIYTVKTVLTGRGL